MINNRFSQLVEAMPIMSGVIPGEAELPLSFGPIRAQIPLECMPPMLFATAEEKRQKRLADAAKEAERVRQQAILDGERAFQEQQNREQSESR